MARGRTTSFTLRLTPAERLALLTWQRAATISAGRARRGWIILLVADGVPITDVAARVGLSRRHVYKWIQRFVHEGLQGLADRPGRGRRRSRRQLLESPTFTPREQEVLTLLATGQPTRRIAEALHLSPKTGSCTCILRLIRQPAKSDKIPSFRHLSEGVLSWSRISFSTSWC